MTTYTARARRSGKWWAVVVPEVDGVFTQARALAGVEAMARDAIALMLNVDPGSFDVNVEADVPAVVTRALAERQAARAAEERADAATTAAVLTLRAQGYSTRDTGALLGLSSQRISQLAS